MAAAADEAGNLRNRRHPSPPRFLAAFSPKEAGPFKMRCAAKRRAFLKSYLRRRAEQGRAAYPVTRTKRPILESWFRGSPTFFL